MVQKTHTTKLVEIIINKLLKLAANHLLLSDRNFIILKFTHQTFC